MYLFSNVLGVFVFDGKAGVIDELLFNGLDDYQNKAKFIEKIRDKHGNLKEPDADTLKKILLHFKNEKFFGDFYSKNIQLSKLGMRNSVGNDVLLIQSIKLIDELDKAINILVKRLREWYELHNPEFSRATESHEKFVEGMLEDGKAELLGKLKISLNDSMGDDLAHEHLEPVKSLAHQVFGLFQLRKLQESYISSLMDGYCPNIKAVCGTMVAAKLVEHAGSLRRLSEMPASTVQILGAEKALFRHMRTGAKAPRHGIIANHALVAGSPNEMHGKIARALADKISIAAKIDYFRGKFIGNELRNKLEEKFGKIK
ncbi:hypothetical protein HYV80_03995 [Candidatus Woesearchaeota archaeon]|nr:hypothetical protein [Candidatus Woesearchaeota archaeon]